MPGRGWRILYLDIHSLGSPLYTYFRLGGRELGRGGEGAREGCTAEKNGSRGVDVYKLRARKSGWNKVTRRGLRRVRATGGGGADC